MDDTRVEMYEQWGERGAFRGFLLAVRGRRRVLVTFAAFDPLIQSEAPSSPETPETLSVKAKHWRGGRWRSVYPARPVRLAVYSSARDAALQVAREALGFVAAAEAT